MVEGMPQGLPEAGDRGLDRTHTWGRTYWGGCLFWLMADVQIREQTNERRSLDDALRAILDAGGDGSVTWPIPRVIETGDRATGVHVLKDLYDEMALKPAQVDLDSFWKKLGVKNVGATAVFDDAAPLASIRKAITAKITSNINK
jgi:predicted metalloprotease with PDZ domain